MTDLPAPLTDMTVDVIGLQGFILSADRLLGSELAALSTGDEFKAATLLWCRAWQQKPAASLPDDERVLASFAGLGNNLPKWRKVRAMAMRGFIKCSDGRLYHPMLAEDAKRAWKARLQKRAAADKRWNTDSTPPEHPPGRAPEHADGYAPASPSGHAEPHAGNMPSSSPVQSSTKDLEFKPSRVSGSGGAASPRPGRLAGMVGIDWQAIVTRMQSHGFTAEAAWTLVMTLDDRADLGRRMQGAMRSAEDKGKTAFTALVSIAKETEARRTA